MIKDCTFMTGLGVQEGFAALQCRRPLRRLLVILPGHGHFDASHRKTHGAEGWHGKKMLSKIRRSCSSCEFREAVIMANGQQVALLNIRSRVLRIRPSPVIGIFLTVDGCYMGWIFV